jgi:alkylhydroperoxidase family enzyme
MARIAPAVPPLDAEIQAALDKVMPSGMEPLALFTTIARDKRLFKKFFASSLLDRGHLTLRQREIVIDRTTARCGSEYEWGIHVTLFAERAALTDAQIHSLVHGNAADGCWSDSERVLIQLCDELHDYATVSGETWIALRRDFTEEAILELLMLAGFYRTVSYLTNALELPLEPAGKRFPKQ